VTAHSEGGHRISILGPPFASRLKGRSPTRKILRPSGYLRATAYENEVSDELLRVRARLAVANDRSPLTASGRDRAGQSCIVWWDCLIAHETERLVPRSLGEVQPADVAQPQSELAETGTCGARLRHSGRDGTRNAVRICRQRRSSLSDLSAGSVVRSGGVIARRRGVGGRGGSVTAASDHGTGGQHDHEDERASHRLTISRPNPGVKAFDAPQLGQRRNWNRRERPACLDSRPAFGGRQERLGNHQRGFEWQATRGRPPLE